MEKIKKMNISDTTITHGKIVHEGKEYSINDVLPLSNYFEFNNHNVGACMLRVREFPRQLTFKQLRKLLMTKCISSLFGSPILTDVTVLKEAKEALFVDYYSQILFMCDITPEEYNPYVLDFDEKKLSSVDKKEFYLIINENHHLCIEKNNRTTNFFRDILMLHNTQSNTILIDYEENSDDLNDLSKYLGKSLNFFMTEKENDNDSCIDAILDSTRDTINSILVKELHRDDSPYLASVIKLVSLVTSNEYDYQYSFTSEELELITEKAKDEINPSLLFMELVSGDPLGRTNGDLQHGFKKLGFIFA